MAPSPFFDRDVVPLCCRCGASKLSASFLCESYLAVVRAKKKVIMREAVEIMVRIENAALFIL